jgi:SPX domain protein involved in polyphosphate accumulation
MSERDENGFRFERKYHVDYMPLAQIEHLVRRNPALFRIAYPDRTINNIYLDTPNRQSLLENLDGIADRTKARIRWYGEMLGRVEKPVLEFKIKRGMVGAKESYRLTPFTVEKTMSAKVVHDALDHSNLPPEVQLSLKKFEPVLLNRYRRKYFISADSHYRITLDYDLEYYRFDRHFNLFTRSVRDYHSTVVELKYSGDIDQIDDRVAGYFPFRVTRMSKFVTGVQSVHFD